MRKAPSIDEFLVHTGQHYDHKMSDIFFADLGMKEPDVNLNVGSGGHGAMTGRMMIELEGLMLENKPDLVLLYGDTNSTLAGAIVAKKLKVPVAHIEAGLRQDPKDMPEEINRVLTDHSSTYLFCPSITGVRNLEAEGITKNVHFVGDVMYDLFATLRDKFDHSTRSSLGLDGKPYIAVTLHRDFNVDRKDVLEPALSSLAELAEEMPVVFPMHPRTRKRVAEFGLGDLVSRLRVIEPLGYLEMMGLVEDSYAVVTDSGGLQKEAYFAGKRAVILMEDSGWRELIDSGWNVLSEAGDIAAKLRSLPKVEYPAGMYGNGDSADKTLEILTGLA